MAIQLLVVGQFVDLGILMKESVTKNGEVYRDQGFIKQLIVWPRVSEESIVDERITGLRARLWLYFAVYAWNRL